MNIKISVSPLVQTDTGSLDTENESSQVVQLPLNGRNVMNLASLAQDSTACEAAIDLSGAVCSSSGLVTTSTVITCA
jgi:hypothetical protein